MTQVALPPEQDRHVNVLLVLVSPQLAVAVFSESAPNADEWREYMNTLSRMSGAGNRIVVFSAGGGPTPTQRKELEDLTAQKSEDLRVAIITASRVARGIVTAIRWYRGDSNVAFDPKHLDLAFNFLDLSAEDRQKVLAYAAHMGKRLGVAEKIGFA